jgi:hypothetical protein
MDRRTKKVQERERGKKLRRFQIQPQREGERETERKKITRIIVYLPFGM